MSKFRFIALATLAIGACSEAPTDLAVPTRSGPGPSMSVVENHVYTSGADVLTWDPILAPFEDRNWPTTVCTNTPLVGRDANWVNPHNAYVLTGHPWAYDYFFAPWINSRNTLASVGPGGHNWTKYRQTVTGNGSFVIYLLADNCSWIYLDGTLVGVQNTNLAANKYGLTLNGTHTLEFIIFDGGGAAGGKFRLETTTNPPPPLNPDLDGDGHPNVSDAFPLDPHEWADTDGDGVGDNGDAFPNNPAEQKDTDGDGVGDNSDAYPLDPTRTSFDADNDGVVDTADNCPAASNADQADLDGDHIGDACDGDIDGDGVANGSDWAPRNPAEWADSDGDGVGNNADPFDNSNTGPFLLVGTCNTGAANWRISGGTWANDLIADAYATAANHGAFVSAVSNLADGWKKAGKITGQQQGAIVSCAAKMK